MWHTAISIEPYVNTVNVVNINNLYDNRYQNYNVQTIFRCPKCYKLFISTYARQHQGGEQFWLISNNPYYPEKIDFKKEIRDLSPNFTEIYQQSHVAESSKLHQIAGCGYRKSLEFLIKDYCIKFLQKENQSISKKFLGNCIEEDLDSDEIKECAKRAAWLGNDESHYIKNGNHDIESLKTLISSHKIGLVQKFSQKNIKMK